MTCLYGEHFGHLWTLLTSCTTLLVPHAWTMSLWTLNIHKDYWVPVWSSYMPTRKSLRMPCCVHTVQRQKEGSVWSETVLGDQTLGLVTAWKLLPPQAKLNHWLSLCKIRFVWMQYVHLIFHEVHCMVWCSVRKSCIVSLACDIRAVSSTGGKDRFSFFFGYERCIVHMIRSTLDWQCLWGGMWLDGKFKHGGQMLTLAKTKYGKVAPCTCKPAL